MKIQKEVKTVFKLELSQQDYEMMCRIFSIAHTILNRDTSESAYVRAFVENNGIPALTVEVLKDLTNNERMQHLM